MRWFVNEASLQGQFHSVDEFEKSIRILLDLPASNQLYLTRSFGVSQATPTSSVAALVCNFPNRELRVRILQWVSKRGPFVDDDRTAEPNDYFECSGVDVTDQGLGEATRRQMAGLEVGAWSFRGGTIDFSVDPLIVQHGLPEDRYGEYPIKNVWSAEDLVHASRNSLPEPKSWDELAEVLKEKYERLLIGDSFCKNERIASEPYESSIADRVLELCRILDEYMRLRSATGEETEQSQQLHRDFFTRSSGGDPPFTPESDANILAFRDQLSFTDPENGALKILAHWHGKIKHRFFRMHFEWPAPKHSRRLKVLYLGPKITKN